MGNRALGKRDKKERRERKLEFTWNGKGTNVWKGRRREGVKEEKEGSELGREKERSGRREKVRKEKVWEEKWELEGKRKEGKEQGGKLGRLTIRIRWLDRYAPTCQAAENTVEA